MADEIDESLYEYSEEKYEQIIKDCNIREAISTTKEIESQENSINEEEINQICVYIRNYNSNGELVSNPRDAIKTCVDTFERTLIKFSWTEYELVDQADGSTKYSPVYKEEIKESSNDASSLADEEVLKVKPHIIESKHFVKSFLQKYFSNFLVTNTNNDRTFYMEYHNTSNSIVEYYDLSFDDINFIKNQGYDKIGLNLDNRKLTIDSDKLMELSTLSIENAKIIITSNAGFNLSVDDLYLEYSTITSSFDNHISSLSFTVSEYAELMYLDFTDDICKFDFLNSNTDNMQKWMKSSVKIYGIDYINNKKSYSYKLENLFNFSSFYSVDISSINITLDTINMSMIKLTNIMNAKLTSINLVANEFKKNPISFNKITDLTCCGIYVTQSLSERNNVYAIFTSAGGLMGEYKFTSIISKNIGFINCNGETVLQINFNSCRCIDYFNPIKYIGSSTNKILFSNCAFDNIEELSLSVPKLSIFDSRFSKIKTMTIILTDKGYINNSTFSGTDLDLEMSNESNILIEDSKIDFSNNIKVQGDSGTGDFKTSSVNLISKIVKFDSMNKISSENSDYNVKELTVGGMNISGFNPTLTNGLLESVDINGKIKNSMMLISNTNPTNIKFNIKNCKGNVSIIYSDYVSNFDLNIDTSQIEVGIDANKDNEEISSKINLKCLNECSGSIISSYKRNMKIIPVAEGSFSNLKMFKDSTENLKTASWKEKIAYGYLE